MSVFGTFRVVSFAVSAAVAATVVSSTDAVGVVPVYNWTGFYVGGHGGYGWGGSDVTPTEGPFTRDGFDTRHSGFVLGGQTGYNWQYNSIVYGVQGRFSWLGGDATASAIPSVFFFGPADYSFRSSWTGSVQGRLGVAFDRVLLYAQGGGAFSELRGHITFSDMIGRVSFQDQKTRAGLVIGGGIEYAVTDQFSVGVLVQHYRWGEQTLELGRNFFGERVGARVTGQETTSRVELNYHFGPGR